MITILGAKVSIETLAFFSLFAASEYLTPLPVPETLPEPVNP
jgi:hypothetical protein